MDKIKSLIDLNSSFYPAEVRLVKWKTDSEEGSQKSG